MAAAPASGVRFVITTERTRSHNSTSRSDTEGQSLKKASSGYNRLEGAYAVFLSRCVVSGVTMTK